MVNDGEQVVVGSNAAGIWRRRISVNSNLAALHNNRRPTLGRRSRGPLEQRIVGEIAELHQLGARCSSVERLTDRRNPRRNREAGQPIVMMAQDHAAWPQQIRLLRYELGERALNRLAVDIAS